MRVTARSASGTAKVTDRSFTFAEDLFNEAMRRRGHRTLRERAEAADVSRQTLYRLREGMFKEFPTCAHKLSKASGLSVSRLFPSISAAPKAEAA